MRVHYRNSMKNLKEAQRLSRNITPLPPEGPQVTIHAVNTMQFNRLTKYLGKGPGPDNMAHDVVKHLLLRIISGGITMWTSKSGKIASYLNCY